MSEFYSYRSNVVCSGCGATGLLKSCQSDTSLTTSSDTGLGIFRVDGWATIDDKRYCPRCKTKPMCLTSTVDTGG